MTMSAGTCRDIVSAAFGGKWFSGVQFVLTAVVAGARRLSFPVHVGGVPFRSGRLTLFPGRVRLVFFSAADASRDAGGVALFSTPPSLPASQGLRRLLFLFVCFSSCRVSRDLLLWCQAAAFCLFMRDLWKALSASCSFLSASVTWADCFLSSLPGRT